MRDRPRSFPSSVPQSGAQRIVQPIARQVEGQHRQHDGQPRDRGKEPFPRTWSRPMPIMSPQVIALGSPCPMKDRVDSISTAEAMVIEAAMIRGGSALGRIPRCKTSTGPKPGAGAAAPRQEGCPEAPYLPAPEPPHRPVSPGPARYRPPRPPPPRQGCPRMAARKGGDRDQGVAQHMAADHTAGAQRLGARGANMVPSPGLEHGGAGQAGVDRGEAKRQRGGGPPDRAARPTPSGPRPQSPRLRAATSPAGPRRR